MDKNEVNTAFEILLEEIEEVFNIISNEGENSLKPGILIRQSPLLKMVSG
ncbi:MAG: hypothetical protein ACP5JH_08130 [Bacteroidota bacterium]